MRDDQDGAGSSFTALGRGDDENQDIRELTRADDQRMLNRGSSRWSTPCSRFARFLMRFQAERGPRLLGLQFDDPSWNILLELFIAQEEHDTVWIGNVCLASGAPPTTALRYLRMLEQKGAVLRQPDKSDARRTVVRLAPAFADRMHDLIDDMRVEAAKAAGAGSVRR